MRVYGILICIKCNIIETFEIGSELIAYSYQMILEIENEGWSRIDKYDLYMIFDRDWWRHISGGNNEKSGE